MLNKSLLALLLTVILLNTWVYKSSADSPPPIPNTFSGKIIFVNSEDKLEAPAGTLIEALIDNVTKGNTTVTTPGNYRIHIKGTYEDDGKIITFNVNNLTAKQKSVFDANTALPRKLNLVFSEDSTPPGITFIEPPTPANNSEVDVDYVNISIVLSEPGDTVHLFWNGSVEDMDGSGTAFFKNMTGLANGVYSYYVHASDAAGNFNTSEYRSVTVKVPSHLFAISGYKINDTNGNGAWDSGEQGIRGWNITLLNAATGEKLTSTTTDAAGFYEFANLAPDNYNVTEETRAGWTATNTKFEVVTVIDGDIKNLNFTNMRIPPPIRYYSFSTTYNAMPITVDGILYPSPQTFAWADGTEHIVSVPAYQEIVPDQSRYNFSGWSGIICPMVIDSPCGSPSLSITAGAGAAKNYTANYSIQYHLTVNTSPSGLVSILGSSWHDSGINVSLQAPGSVVKDGATYNFATWKVDDNPVKGNPIYVRMNASRIATAVYVTIIVVSPNGGDNWIAGTKQVIRWTYTGNPGTRVKIELQKGGAPKGTIAFSAPLGSNGSGSYNWSIPAFQTQGTDYKIRITSTAKSAYNDTSDGNFTIKVLKPLSIMASPGMARVNIPVNITFKVTSMGKPVDNATVRLNGAGITANATTNPAGLAVIRVLAASRGQINVSASKDDYRNATGRVMVI